MNHTAERVGPLPAPIAANQSLPLSSKTAWLKTRLHAACLQMVHSSFGIVAERERISISGPAMSGSSSLSDTYMIWARLPPVRSELAHGLLGGHHQFEYLEGGKLLLLASSLSLFLFLFCFLGKTGGPLQRTACGRARCVLYERKQ